MPKDNQAALGNRGGFFRCPKAIRVPLTISAQFTPGKAAKAKNQ
jgi:hypothetical protein